MPQSPGAAVLPQDVLDPVRAGDLPVFPPRLYPVQSHGDDHKLSPIQGSVWIGRRFENEVSTGLCVHPLCHTQHQIQAISVDVHKDDVAAL